MPKTSAALAYSPTPNDQPASETRLRSVPPVAMNDTLAMTYAQAVADYGGLVSHHARRHVCPGVELNDLIQEGYLGLFIAADKWRADGGASFGNYATMWILESLHTARLRGRRRGMTIGRGNRKASERTTRVTLGTVSIDIDDDDAPAVAFSAAVQEDELGDAEETALVTGAISALPARDRELLTMWAVEGLTYRQIAKRVGLRWADTSGRGKHARAAGTCTTSAISRWTRGAFEGLCHLLKARGFEGDVRVDGRRPGRKLADKGHCARSRS